MWLVRIVVVVLLAFQVPAAERVRTALETASKETPDGTDFAETPGYRELIAALIELKPIDVEALGPVPIDAARALADPALARGAWVRARGHAILKHPTALQSPVASVHKVERIILKLDPDTRIVCDLIGDPPPYKNTDTVEVSGVFFRTVSYENANGARVTLPYVLARSMELVDTPSSTLGKSLVKGGQKLLLGVLLGGIGVVVFVLYLRRSARSEG